jgi:hypothetical protein
MSIPVAFSLGASFGALAVVFVVATLMPEHRWRG